MIRAVIFDIDDTLYNYKRAHAAALPAVRRYVEEHLGLDGEEFLCRYKEMMDRQRLRCGETAAVHNRYIRFQMLMEEYGLPLRHVMPLGTLYWRELLSHAAPEPDAAESMDQLRAQGIRIGAGTDMTLDWQLEKLDTLGLIDRVDFIVTSEEAGVEKPEARFFALCQHKAGCQKEECLFVGDSLRKDVLGAQAFGFHAAWYQPDPAKAAQQPQVPRLQTFGELPALVSRF